MADIAAASKLEMSDSPMSIFCFLAGGPVPEGVKGTADRGVGG